MRDRKPFVTWINAPSRSGYWGFNENKSNFFKASTGYTCARAKNFSPGKNWACLRPTLDSTLFLNEPLLKNFFFCTPMPPPPLNYFYHIFHMSYNLYVGIYSVNIIRKVEVDFGLRIGKLIFRFLNNK